MPPDARIPRRNAAAAAATPLLAWRQRRVDSAAAPVSARKLAASLWRLAPTASSDYRLGFEFCSSLPIPQTPMEEATKLDFGFEFHRNNKLIITSAAFTGKTAENHEIKLKHRMRKTKEETEHEMMRSVIKNLANKIKIERKICKNIDKMNSDLLRDITVTRSSARKFIKNLEKETKAREALDGVCCDQAREIEARKAEIEALRDEQRRIRTEVEEERRMLQMAEVWREEKAQMKLNEAKLILEYKYVELHSIISSLRAFVRSSDSEEAKAEAVRRAFDLVKDLKLLIPESDEGFAVVKDSEVWARPGGDVRSCKSRKASMNRSSFGSVPSSNPHIVRAMKGHVEWPWRMRENGKGGEAENCAEERALE